MLTELLYHFRRRQRVHLLHIGKTGGTALKAAFSQRTHCPNYIVIPHRHSVTLRDIPKRDLFMFVVRDPIVRFVSAFYSRQRQGRPRYSFPWSEAERGAFARFGTPNDLALALTVRDEALCAAAETAMRSIRHVQTSYWDWFESEAYFRSRAKNLLFIGRLETLSADFERLRVKLRLPASVVLPEDAVATHRTPDGLDRHLEPDALQALTRWYAAEFDFLRLCRELDASFY